MDAKVLRIITLLTEQTKEGKIKWEATGTANEYKVQMSGGTVVISYYISGTSYCSFKLYNEYGILALQESRSKSTQNYDELRELYIAAKDSFTGKDVLVDNILKQLTK